MSDAGDVRSYSLSRRAFLFKSGAVGVLAAAILTGHDRVAGAAPISEGWPAWLLDADNQDAVMRLGEAYLAAYPTQRDATVLAGYIERALAATAVASADSGTKLQSRVRYEYAQDEVIPIKGWVMAVSEARLYALVTLLVAVRTSDT
jgi:hypothetical protein